MSKIRLIGATAALWLAACSASAPPATEPVSTPDPGVRPGDVVALAIWREEDLSGSFTVDERGIVTLPLLGECDVAGRRAEELRVELVEGYREYLRNPSIEVRVLRRVNILGAVNAPGLYPVDATISLSEAIGLAGGIAPTGDPDDIRVVRGDRVIARDLTRTTPVAATDVRSGDQIVVGEKGWLERNPAALVGSLIAAAAGITIALVR